MLLSRLTAHLNSSSEADCCTKVKELSLPYNLPIATATHYKMTSHQIRLCGKSTKSKSIPIDRWITNGFILFPPSLAVSKNK